MKKLIFIILILTLLSGCSANKSTELSDTQFLMDTVCTIRVGGAEDETLNTALKAAFDKAYEVAEVTDYYSASSDVTAINKAQANQAVQVSTHTISILSTALDICEKSQGALDITIAPLKDLWGFNKGEHTPPSDDEIKSALSLVDYKKIIVNKEDNTVTKTDTNTKIDLGGCAKGYAEDCVLEILKSYNVEYALIDFGGSILTYGENPSRKDKSWIVGIQKPFSQNGEIAKTITADNSAVVTSGTYQRYFEWNNKKYHHILDTNSGYPTDNSIASASVTHSSALTADCLSTACLVLGNDKGYKLAKHYNADVIYIFGE